MTGQEQTIDIESLYTDRARRVQKRNQRYLRLLFNDHFVVFLLLMAGAVILVLQSLQRQNISAPAGWPAYTAILAVAWLILGLQFGSLVTYLQPADRLFLAAADRFLTARYLEQAWLWSFALASLWQIGFVALAWPLLQMSGAGDWQTCLGIFLVQVAFKLLDLTFASARLKPLRWRSFFSSRWWPLGFRLVFPGLFYGVNLFTNQFLRLVLTALLVVVTVGFFAYWRFEQQRGGQAQTIDWQRALQMSHKHDQAIWRFYSLFAQVPSQGVTVKRRRAFDRLLAHFSFQKDPVRRLFWIKLLRGGDELSLAVRISIVGTLILLALPKQELYWFGGGMLLLIYLVNFQLLPVFGQSQSVLWSRLILPDKAEQSRRFRLVLTEISLTIIGLIFATFVIIDSIAIALTVLLAGLLMVAILNWIWLPKVLMKQSY